MKFQDEIKLAVAGCVRKTVTERINKWLRSGTTVEILSETPEMRKSSSDYSAKEVPTGDLTIVIKLTGLMELKCDMKYATDGKEEWYVE